MGLFSGDSKSSTTNTDDDLTVTGANYADGIINNNTYADNSNVSGGKNSTINVTKTDHGAVDNSFALSTRSLDFAESALDNVTGLAEKGAANMASLAQSVSRTDTEKNTKSSTFLVLSALVGAGVLVFLVRKK